jgi:uncharacterized membrane protein
MRTFMAIMFSSESGAYEGLRALQHLHAGGTITVHETAVIRRESDGSVTTKFTSQAPLRHTGLGAVVGALVGIVGGPIGALVGATTGGFVGAINGAVRETVRIDYAEHIGEHLVAGTFAVLAEVHENTPGQIDARMAELGGKVMRETRTAFFDEMREKQAQTRRAERHDDQLALASEHAEKQELYLEAALPEAGADLRRTAEAAREQLDKTKRELDDKIKTLESQIAQAGPEVRKDLDQRLTEIRRELGERQRKLSHALEIAREALQP